MATKKRTPNAKKRPGGGHDDAPPPIFGSDSSDMIPGELIMQLDETASAAITASIPRGPTRGFSVTTTTSGNLRLDAVLNELKVSSILRLHPPPPVHSVAMTEAKALASTFRVSFDPSTEIIDAADKLAQVEGVEYVEPNRYRESSVVPNDPRFATQWGLSKIRCPAAWDRTTGAPGIVVAVIDTGIDLDHPELAPLLVAGSDMVDLGLTPTPPPGFRFEGDFAGRDGVPQDEVGHGTHVAGTIACLSNNATGVAGVTWNCRLMPVRVLARIVSLTNPADVRGIGSAADIAAGIRWAVDNGARVLNLSLGGPTDTRVERDAIAYAVAHGVVVCAAMGNAGAGAGPSFPAAYPDVVAVGAIDSADARAAFSQVGPHIDIAAPGVGILSTVWDNGFSTMSGTSMATPHVAGVAALVLSCNPGLTAAQVADILRQTARPLRDRPADPIPNNNYGFGCVDAEAAVNRACPRLPLRTVAVSCRQSREILCRQTLAISCQSLQILCRQTLDLRCQTLRLDCAPSRITLCRSVQLICQTRDIRCIETQPVICRGPSLALRCPTGPICGDPGRPGNPEPFGAQGQNGCCGGAAGWDDTGIAAEDPYAAHYEGDEYDGE